MEYKCLIVGDKSVGKSSFIKRHLTGDFLEQYQPTDSLSVTPLLFQTNHSPVTFQVYDGGYNSKPDCAVIMFDTCNRESWEHVMVYYHWLEAMFGEIPVVICGNKVDQKDAREVKSTEIAQFLHETHRHLPLIYFDVSARTSYNYEKPFLFLWRKLNFPRHSYRKLIESPLTFMQVSAPI